MQVSADLQRPEPSRIDDRDLAMMLFIRGFEQALLEAFSQGRLHGTTHTCLGQEYIPVALTAFLTEDDFQIGNHRGHGHYLARFNDPVGLLAEIMGRDGAVCSGVGGSQHVYRRHQYMSTGVMGESLPVAVGAALHFKRNHPSAMAIAQIGDGTWGQGAVYEALNIASLWKLPLLVVVENNHIAQSTPIELQMAGDIGGRAAAFGIRHLLIQSDDLQDIRGLLRDPIDQIRTQRTPCIVEFDTVRIGPHSSGDDTRPAQQLAALAESDWYPRYRERFAAQFRRLEGQAAADVKRVFDEVAARPLSTWSQS